MQITYHVNNDNVVNNNDCNTFGNKDIFRLTTAINIPIIITFDFINTTNVQTIKNTDSWTGFEKNNSHI